jgi:FKBP-type peptidyl-prolyl cis-trans isomerase
MTGDPVVPAPSEAKRDRVVLAVVGVAVVATAVAIAIAMTKEPPPDPNAPKIVPLPNKRGVRFEDPSPPMRTTESGLRYGDWVEGTGETPRPGQFFRVQYTGWLQDGTRFDGTRDRGSAKRWKLGPQLIQGWQEAVATMKVGGHRKVIIPPALAYGSNEKPGIPANSTLTFEIELIAVEPMK